MSSIAELSFKTSNHGLPPSRTGLVPEKKKHLRRSLCAFMLDKSGSTGIGNMPDIVSITDVLNQMIANLCNPTPGSKLANNIDKLDVCVWTYDTTPTLLIPWSLPNELPTSIPPLTAGGGTNTGAALDAVFAYTGDRLRSFKDPKNNIRSGLLTIINLTDGFPTDLTVGSPRWRDLQAKLGKLAGVEKRYASLVHFISPNGCISGDAVFNMKDEHGMDINGQQAMALLSGPKSVFELSKEAAAFDSLVSVLTSIIIDSVTTLYGPAEAGRRAASQTNGLIKPTENYDI